MAGLKLEEFSEIRRAILTLLKQDGAATIAKIAERLDVTYEAIRQQMVQLEKEGWVNRSIRRDSRRSVGRPISRYGLTSAGDHLFPKHYDMLAANLINTMNNNLGLEAVEQVLTSLTETQISKWEPLLKGMYLAERINALKGIYFEDDPFMEIESTDEGIRLIERNCPFLNVASQYPPLCSITVSTLTKLLGVRVVREERFQNGDGRCVFRVLEDQPIDSDTFSFEFEEQHDS